MAAESDADHTNDTALTTADANVVKHSNDHSSLSASENNDTLGDTDDGSFTSLYGKIQSSGGTVTLENDYLYNNSKDGSYKDGIPITANVHISGNIKIDANKQARIFNIASGCSVTLEGITFINGNSSGNGGAIISLGVLSVDNCKFYNNTANNNSGYAGHGGAIYLDNSSHCEIKNSDFIGNNAESNGGALDWYMSSTYGVVENCYFENNTARRSGGAIHWSGYYGRVSNSRFVNNKATGDVTSVIGGILGGGDGGAIVWVGSHGVIDDNCNFTNNYAKYRGGAVFLHGNSTENCTNITVDGCTFEYNIAGLNGGAIDWQKGSENGTLSNSIFNHNIAWRSGGAVYWNGINGTIEYCDFTDNHAIGNVTNHDQSIANYTTDGGNGGAVIWTGPQGTVNNCNFTSNTAKVKGGAVYLQGTSYYTCNNTKFDTCRFISNGAGINGGAIDWYQGAMNGNVNNCIFENNNANRSGGAIFWSGVNGTIKNSNFTNNTALGIAEYNDTYGNLTYGGYGGAVMWTGSNGLVDNCRFITNEAKYNPAENSGGRGGAVYLQGAVRNNVITNCTNTTFSNCNFTGNIAGTNGGAIDWHEGAHDGHVINSTFTNNRAKANGGAIYWRGHDGEIINSNFTSNTAEGLYEGTYHNIGDGGAIFWAGLNGDVENCRFIDNVATNNTINNNTGRGGAVYLGQCNHGNDNTTFKDCYFENNTAGSNGGALDWSAGATNGFVIHSEFYNNTAKRSGGAIHWSGFYGTIRDSIFEGNKATKEIVSEIGGIVGGGDGGAVLWVGSHGIVKNCTFTSNYAKLRGGAVFIHGNSTENSTNTTVDNCTFKYNTAEVNGGGVDWQDGAHNGKLINSIFISNYAWRSGGGAYWNGYNGTMKNCNFTNNHASGNWSGTVPEGVVIVTDTIGGNGGAMVWRGSLGDIENCNFTSNTALYLGGAIHLRYTTNVTFTYCNFTRNHAGVNLGGVTVDDTVTMSGGAIYFNTGAVNCTIDSSVFEHNIAETNGGAIAWIQGAEHGVIDTSVFTNNTARRNGGAVYWNGHNGTVLNSKFYNNRATGENWEWSLHINMGDTIVREDDGTLILCDIIVRQNSSLPIDSDILKYRNKLLVLNYTWYGNLRFESYVVVKKGLDYTWKPLDEVSINISESIISPVDWAIDQYFGGDGGTILWSGDLGYVYNCTFVDSNSARRGGGAYMTGCDYVTYESCNFTNCTSGTNGGGVDWLAGANNGKIYNCIFNQTRAARSAGAIYYDGWYSHSCPPRRCR